MNTPRDQQPGEGPSRARGAGARGKLWLIAGGAALLVALALGAAALAARRPSLVVLVRHADRHAGADALTSAGEARAQDLARALAKLGVDAIYTSEFRRTQATAAPTASALGLTPVAVPARDVDDLVRRIDAHPGGDTVLVVGHSDTLPKLIAALGGPSLTIDHAEYDDLFLLRRGGPPWQPVELANLQYGAETP